MEIRTYNLRQKVDELKDLPENTLMAIAELCMDYYKLGQFSVEEDINSDKQAEIDELQNQLDDSDYEYHKLENQYEDLEDLLKEVYLCDSIKEAKETIELFSESNGYDYKWEFLEKK